jgi:site-specific DNA recombinase
MKTKPNTTKLRFAALRRVSTEQQEKIGESLRTQTKDIQEIVSSLGSIVEWYGGQEHATPGHEKKEVERLLRDAQKQHCPFNAVIVAHPDRWSRDNSASRAGLEVFREHGIRFFAGATEYDLFNPDHELFLGISAVVGQFQARNQMRKSLINRINRAKRGVPTGGKLPFGRIYVRSNDRQDGHWEIDSAKQRIVQDCARRYLAGESIEDLAKEYDMNVSNLHKVLTQRSGPKWQVEFQSKVLNIHEVIEIEVPPLLPAETIRAIIAKAEANRTYTHGHIKHQYLFSRMIQCQHCGYAMFGQTNKNGFQYYRHAHTARDRQCPGAEIKSWIPAAEIEDAAMRHLFETFGNPSAVQRAMEEATPNNERVQEAVKRLEFVTKELSKLESSRQRILALIVKGTISEGSANTQLEKLKEREDKLGAERARLDDELAHVPSKPAIAGVWKQVAARFRQYTNAREVVKVKHANAAFDEMTFKERRELCQTVFSGKTAEGSRMGVWISWDKSGKKWGYRIEGHLIDASGPVSKEGFVFGAPLAQKELVTKHANY